MEGIGERWWEARRVVADRAEFVKKSPVIGEEFDWRQTRDIVRNRGLELC